MFRKWDSGIITFGNAEGTVSNNPHAQRLEMMERGWGIITKNMFGGSETLCVRDRLTTNRTNNAVGSQ